MSLLVNPNSVQDERDRLLKVVSGTFKLMNAALGYVLNCKKRKPVTLCEHCDPWLPLEEKGYSIDD